MPVLLSTLLRHLLPVTFSVTKKLGRNSVKSFISYWIPILYAINVLLLWFVLLNLCDGYGTGNSASLFLPLVSIWDVMASKRLRSATKVRNIQNRKPNPSIWFHAQVLWWIGEKDFVKVSVNLVNLVEVLSVYDMNPMYWTISKSPFNT